jgi:quercetin 2,3-dioxygenase
MRTAARVLGASLKAGESTEYALGDGRLDYLVPAHGRGRVEVNGVTLQERDGSAISDEAAVRVTALDDAELLLVDLAA